mgnify:CR=1 FL=1
MTHSEKVEHPYSFATTPNALGVLKINSLIEVISVLQSTNETARVLYRSLKYLEKCGDAYTPEGDLVGCVLTEGGNAYVASEIADRLHLVTESLQQVLGSELSTGLVNADEYPPRYPKSVASADERSRRHLALMHGIPAVAAYLHTTTEPFFHLKVHAPIEARLNRPPTELQYEPLTVQRFPSEVIEIRRHCLAKALANGQPHSDFYELDDLGHHWKFRYTAIPLYGSEEVLAIVEDAEDWQGGYWETRQ